MQNAGTPLWDDLRVLLALHRHRSFLAAGKALGVSTSTAARRIDALEAALGRPLVHRSNGGTSVEPDALDLVALAEQIESRLRAIRRDEGEEALSGTVRVSLTDTIVQPVTKLLCDLRRLYPGLLLEILSEVRLVDLARREADIAVRSSKSSSPAVVHRAGGRVPLGLYAAPSYVERRLRGGRLKVADLERHDFVGYEGMPGQESKMAWLEAHGARRFVLRSNSHFALLEAALHGQGIALMAEPAVRSTAGLVRIEVDAELPSVPVFLAYHRELRGVPRVRLVLDALDAALRDALR
ncbi:LysR family transcriptional regulator [Sorangium cellulosum]|uniref:LysR family transcriptional regulator n=1 Tax=Sorangium cellulosum TaxID=56 RepID=A0A150PHK5_SORCE|nr:LysR family transcriptional regulator [Sorangium cellulosum]